MTAQLADPLWPFLAVLTATLDEVLDEFDAATCRTFVAPGASAVWDVCCPCARDAEGQAWVAVQSYGPSDTFPNLSNAPLRCKPDQYVATVDVGVLRCASTVDDAGNAPSSDLLIEEAQKVSRDRTLVQYALLCRFAEEADLYPGEIALGTWVPLGPQGGCVGGQTTVSFVTGGCRCTPTPPPPPTSGFGIDPFGTDPFGQESA